MLATLTIDDIAVGDIVRAASHLGRPLVGVVVLVDAEDRGGVVDIRPDGGTDDDVCWRRLDQILMVVGPDGVTKYATGPGWR